MFWEKGKKYYQELLATESDARQIRTSQNKILAGNAKGQALFGDKENPFSFLKDAQDVSVVQKIVDSFCTATPIETEVRLPKTVYNISIRKLHKNLLIVAQDKTAEYAIQEGIIRQNAFLSDVLSTFAYPIYLTDKTGRFIYVNRSCCAFFQKNFNEILDTSLQNYVYENCPDFQGYWQGTTLFSPPSGIEARFVSQRSFEMDNTSYYAGLIEPLRISAPSVDDHIFRESPLPTVVIDAVDQRIIYTNPAFLAAFKTPDITSFDHMDVRTLFSDNTQEILLNRLSKLLNGSGKNERMELIAAPAFGNKTFSVFAGFTTQEKDAFILYLVDASERKNLEMQFAHAQKMQAIGQLAGGVAHDFNNLLTAIIGYCDLLLTRHNERDPSFWDIMQIKGNANKASGLVGQLLTFSRKQPSKIQIVNFHDSFVDLSALLQRSIAPFVTLQTNLKRNLGFIKIDPNQLTQIFLNLAVNAKDAMPNGGVLEISAVRERFKKAKPIGNDMIQAGEYIKIVVSDNGSGIASEDLPHIFEPFFTTKSTTSGSGTGLGLSTVYGIIRGSGGYISVDSEKGIGTTFIIYLPRVEPKVAPAPEVKVSRPVFIPSQRNRILLVDDEDGVRLVVSRVLRTKGFIVTECANAEQALEVLNKRTNFDLLLTDMIMPGMDGESLIKLVKKAHPEIKALLMSGYSEDMARHGSSENKELEFLPKPFELAQLLDKVREVLQKQEERI